MAAAVTTVAVGVLPAQADPGDASRLLALTNQVRAAKGLPALTIDSQLTSVAQAWAVELAGRGVISHNPSVRSQVTGWKVLGENVGVGGTVDAVHAGFVASPTHYANLVDSAYTKVGYGIVRPDARILVVEVFMLPASAPAAAPVRVAAAPAPTSAPVPATPVPTVKPAAAPAPAPSAARPPAGPAAELSPWMVHSMERLRSMGSPSAG
ncbi:MAG TPA: CAP domain-containing protein [Acidimicrobiales bacterium]|nr:CAP domain-containing protein [Acidimicrobiales bacterium]